MAFGCAEIEAQSNSDSIKFKDLVAIDNISQVRVSNNSGDHEVTNQKRTELLQKLGEMTLDKNGSYKVGGKSIELTIDGEKYTLLGRTKGDYFEVTKTIVTKNRKNVDSSETLYFKANGLNIDNY
jgi:hypothetical protein